MTSKNKIYCIYCGKVNDIANKKCRNCGKILNEEEHELRDFIFEETKSQLEGNIFDKIANFIKKLVTKHLYGVILSVSIITTSVGVILNATSNSTTSDIPLTDEKYVFSELNDAVKLTGCWKGKSNIDTDNNTRYIKFYNYEKALSTEVSENYNSKFYESYYLVFDEETTFGTTKNLYFGPSKVIEAQYFNMLWVDDNTFRYGELNYAETKYERISCDEFPTYNEEDVIRY